MDYNFNSVGVSQDSIIDSQSRRINLQDNQMNALHQTNYNLSQHNQALLCNLNQQNDEIERLRRSNQALKSAKRRKHTQDKITAGPDQHLYLNRYYDDNTHDSISLLLPFYGLATIYRAVFSDCPAMRPCLLIIIEIEGSKHGQNPVCILLDLGRLNNKQYIYDSFCQSQVIFNPLLKATDIQNALKTYILQQASRPDIEKWFLHGQSGWITNIPKPYFYSCENAGFENIQFLASLPVMSKSFNRLTPDAKAFLCYFQELNAWFPELHDRLLILLSPFIGLLYSLLKNATGFVPTFIVNLVAHEDFLPEYAASWLQIYNRSSLSAIDASLPLKQLEQKISEMKDDLMLLDARTYSGETDYSKQKKHHALTRLHHLVRYNTQLGSGQRISCMFVYLSGEIIKDNALNLVIPNADCDKMRIHQAFLDSRCMDHLLSCLVEYVENNFNNACRILRKKRCETHQQADLLEAVFDLLTAFFKEEGYDLNHALNIPIPYNFAKLFEREEGDDLESFVELVLSAICEYVSCPKRRGADFDPSVLYYDSEWLYFPQPLLRQIYKDAHLDSQLNRDLIFLRNEKHLWPDVENGTTKKVKFNGVYQYLYVIRRSLFQTPGDLDIIDRTKEAM